MKNKEPILKFVNIQRFARQGGIWTKSFQSTCMDGAIKNVTLLGHAPYDTAKYEKRAKVSIFTHVIPRQATHV